MNLQTADFSQGVTRLRVHPKTQDIEVRSFFQKNFRYCLS